MGNSCSNHCPNLNPLGSKSYSIQSGANCLPCKKSCFQKNNVISSQGMRGDVGPKGDSGCQGSKGCKGDTGPAGPPGPRGTRGPIGDLGSMGPRGEQGPAGPQGEWGCTGPQGESGEQGVHGRTGPQGPQGDRGCRGPVGAPGPSGLVGATGAAGCQVDDIFAVFLDCAFVLSKELFLPLKNCISDATGNIIQDTEHSVMLCSGYYSIYYLVSGKIEKPGTIKIIPVLDGQMLEGYAGYNTTTENNMTVVISRNLIIEVSDRKQLYFALDCSHSISIDSININIEKRCRKYCKKEITGSR